MNLWDPKERGFIEQKTYSNNISLARTENNYSQNIIWNRPKITNYTNTSGN